MAQEEKSCARAAQIDGNAWTPAWYEAHLPVGDAVRSWPVYLPPASCTSVKPVAVLGHGFAEPGRKVHVEAERCRPYLFGFIPLKKPFWTSDVIRDATGTEAVPLDGLTVDSRSTFWVLGSTRCD